MELKLDKIIREWSYRTETGIPDVKNYKHIQLLSKILEELNYPQAFIFEYIGELMKESSAEVVGATLAQAREKAEKGQTYTSKLSKKVYTRGKEDEGPEIVGGEEEEEEKKDKPKQQSNGYTGHKDKTLTKGNPADTNEYKRDLEPNDEEFNRRNTDPNPRPPEPISLNGIVKDPKFPKRYMKVLERMMNTKNTTASGKYSNFSDSDPGQGKIAAQAGELMAMTGTAMTDEEFGQFTNRLLEHEQKLLEEDKARFERGETPLYHKIDNKTGKINDDPGSRIINTSWIESSKKTRKVMKDQIKKAYGEGAEIIATGWDAKDEVEAMGLKDYKKNKGYSTDMYIKVKKPDGDEILVEVSLKKDKNVNFLNSGTGKIIDLDSSLEGTAIDPTEYAKQEKRRLRAGAAKILPKNVLNSPNIQNALKVLKGEIKGKARPNSKLILKAIEAEKKNGNKDAIAYKAADDKAHKEMKEKALNTIKTNKKVREGIIDTIKNEFPLKGVSEGEETMAIGDMSLDKHTMEKVFGTNNFEELKERFKLERNAKGEPYLAYSVEGEEVIPIASIGIRQDGRGYGGSTIKFEMGLHPELAEKLKTATEEVYK